MKRYIKSHSDIRLTDAEFDEFLELLDEYGEFAFGDPAEIKEQLETTLNIQGYWSGLQYRFYYDAERGFYVQAR